MSIHRDPRVPKGPSQALGLQRRPLDGSGDQCDDARLAQGPSRHAGQDHDPNWIETLDEEEN